MRRGKTLVTRETAEALAARALLFLAEDPARLGRFLADTGVDPATLRASMGSPELLASVLGHLVADESALLMFAANLGVAPEEVVRSHLVLDGQLD